MSTPTFYMNLYSEGTRIALMMRSKKPLQTLLNKVMDEYQENTNEELEQEDQSYQTKIDAMVAENENIKKQIEIVKKETEDKFKQVQQLMIKNSIQQKEEEKVIMQAQESLDKEIIRSELIDVELTEYQEEYEKLLDTNINDGQIIKISLDHCFKQAQKYIPNFKEKYENSLMSDLKTDFCLFTTKLLKIIKEESQLLSSSYLSKLSSLRDQLASEKELMESDARSLSALAKLTSLTKSPSCNLFEILRAIKSSKDISQLIQSCMHRDVSVLTGYNQSTLTPQEQEYMDSVFTKVLQLAAVAANPERWAQIQQAVTGDSWIQRVNSIMLIDLDSDMQVDAEIGEEHIQQVLDLIQ